MGSRKICLSFCHWQSSDTQQLHLNIQFNWIVYELFDMNVNREHSTNCLDSTRIIRIENVLDYIELTHNCFHCAYELILRVYMSATERPLASKCFNGIFETWITIITSDFHDIINSYVLENRCKCEVHESLLSTVYSIVVISICAIIGLCVC